jgi:hypothetical protein
MEVGMFGGKEGKEQGEILCGCQDDEMN